MSTIKLGIIAKDKITRFQGTVTGKASYLTGCNQYLVTPKCEEKLDGSFTSAYPTGTWIDEGRLKFVSEGFKAEDVKAEANGCDIAAPVK